jgi:prepilin-type N-terminal cleavage/methylation domain-containing protein
VRYTRAEELLSAAVDLASGFADGPVDHTVSTPVRSSSAFTIVEIMIVVVIIGLLAAMTVPALKRINTKSQATAVANNLRVFRDAFETYALENGGWPAESAQGVVPPEMEGKIPDAAWQATMPGGHAFDWDNSINSIPAAISIRHQPGPVAFFEQIDRLIDDGNTSTGAFQLLGDRYMLILEK